MRLRSRRAREDAAPVAAEPRVERFERHTATDTHVLLRLVAAWPHGRAPGAGDEVDLVALRDGEAERGDPLPAAPGGGEAWHASFAMALEIACDPDTTFALERDGVTWTLPGPVDIDSPPPTEPREGAAAAELRRELAHTRDLLADREAELDEAQSSARSGYQHAHEARLESARLIEALEQRDAELQEARSELAARESRITDLKLAVERTRLAMTAAEQAADESARMQAALEANAERRERELAHLRSALDDERSTVSALQDSVAELQAARERLDEELG